MGTNWILTDSPSLGAGLTVNDVSAHFSTKQVSGSSGCNSFGTGYTVDGSKMTIDPNIVSTRRAGESGPTAVASRLDLLRGGATIAATFERDASK